MTRVDDKILLRRYHEDGDLQAREQLIEQYMSLVRSLARRYSYRGEQLEDLVQIGAIGLIKAIDRFDLDRGAGDFQLRRVLDTVCDRVAIEDREGASWVELTKKVAA